APERPALPGPGDPHPPGIHRRPADMPWAGGRGGSALGEVLARPERGLDPVGHADALEHAGEVGLDGSLGDLQSAGDLLVRHALPDEAEHLAFARGQVDLLAPAPALLDEHPPGPRVERGVAGVRDPYALDHF